MKRTGLALLVLVVMPGVGWGQAGADWNRVKQVAAGTDVRVTSAQRGRVACTVEHVDDEQLVCSQRRTRFFVPVTRDIVFARAGVREVRLTRRWLSGVAGLGAGVGVGVGVGYGLQNAATKAEDPNLLPALLGMVGGAVGATVGARTDFLGGPVIYRVP